MNNILKVIISSLFLIVTFFTLSLTWEACGNKAETGKTLDQKADEAFEKYETEDDYFEDDLSDFEEDNEASDDNADYSSEDEPTVDYSDYEDKGQETEPVKSTPRTRVSSDGGARYMVVAGNFLVKENATEMVDKLQNMGYNGAEWAVFDYSQYYTVVASRTNNYSEAESVSSALKGLGVDNYVHTKK